MTAAERLRALAGTSGSAAALLLAVSAGITAGQALNDYSSIDTGTAAAHLLSEKVDRRPRTNPYLKLQQIRDAHVALSGAVSYAQVGTLTAHGRHDLEPLPIALPGVAILTAPPAYGRYGQLNPSGASVAALCCAEVLTEASELCGYGGAGTVMAGGASSTVTGAVEAGGGGCAAVDWSEEAEAFVADLSGRGVKNPTEEELALLVLQLVS